jgi:hypothetical protein
VRNTSFYRYGFVAIAGAILGFTSNLVIPVTDQSAQTEVPGLRGSLHDLDDVRGDVPGSGSKDESPSIWV